MNDKCMVTIKTIRKRCGVENISANASSGRIQRLIKDNIFGTNDAEAQTPLEKALGYTPTDRRNFIKELRAAKEKITQLMFRQDVNALNGVQKYLRELSPHGVPERLFYNMRKASKTKGFHFRGSTIQRSIIDNDVGFVEYDMTYTFMVEQRAELS